MLVTVYVVTPYVTVEGIIMLEGVAIVCPVTLASVEDIGVYVISLTVKGGSIIEVLLDSLLGITFANNEVVQHKIRQSNTFFIIFYN